jgi:hypothetical protein
MNIFKKLHRELIETRPELNARMPNLGVNVLGLRTSLFVVKKVLSKEGQRILASGLYKDAAELALEQPGLWIPTKTRRLCKNRVVTTAFVNDIVDCLTVNGTQLALFDDYKYHDCGIGTGAESAADTALGTPWGGARVVGTQIEGTSTYIYKSVATITFNATKAITEHGLFNASTTGQLMDRTLFAAINVVDTNQIEFTYNITFTAGG